MVATPPAGLRNDRAGIGGPENPLESGGSGPAESQRFFRQGDLQDRLRDIYAAASRSNTAIYTLDPRGLGGDAGLVASGVDLGASRGYQNDARTVLRLIAEQTDARAIVSRNDLIEGLDQVLRDASVYYLIGYTSSAVPDGEFHEIEVRARRPGTRVRARPGYWAATEADVARAAAPAAPRAPAAIEDALASIAEPVRAARAVRVWTGASRAADGSTALMVVWEPLPPPPGVTRAAPARVRLTAVAADGDLVFRGSVPEGSGAAGPYAVRFAAAPGTLELDLSVEDETGARVDTLAREVEVPAFPDGQPAASTPRVFRARNAVELRTLSADAAAVPTPAREFLRSERLLIRFDVYPADGVAPGVGAVLLNRAGGRMAELPVTAAQAGGTHQIDLGLSSMPPGEYLVEIVVDGAVGPTLVALRISG
jgi:hypothetical protein